MFESIGAPELLVIIVVALIIFGPRKLPELSRSLGKSLAEFRRHSDEFKRTWEREVEMETVGKEARISEAMPEDNSILGAGQERSLALSEASGGGDDQAIPQARGTAAASESTAAANLPVDASPSPANAADATQPTSKRDWL
ncbi:MAG: twin-arginine translocase TatA/TatE family subunit [Pyrinomonadaceae bacterium]